MTRLDASRQETRHIRPVFLPDGDHFLFVAQSRNPENTGVFAGSLQSEEIKRLLATELKVAFAPPDHLLFVRDTTLMAQQFDEENLALMGDPVPVAQDINSNPGPGQAGFSVSENGILAYRSGGSIANRQLLLTDRTGRRLGLAGTPAAYQNPSFSPDGQFVAVNVQDQSRDIWIMNIASGTMSRTVRPIRVARM